MVTRLTKAIRTFTMNMTTATPDTKRIPEISRTTLSFSTLLMLSTSLEIRLMRSPWGCRSKKRSDRVCNLAKRCLRMAITVFWDTLAIT